jgi:hypothetical protein
VTASSERGPFPSPEGTTASWRVPEGREDLVAIVTPAEALRLVMRVRRVSYRLGVTFDLKTSHERGYESYELVRVTQAEMARKLGEFQRFHDQCVELGKPRAYVKVRLSSHLLIVN